SGSAAAGDRAGGSLSGVPDASLCAVYRCPRCSLAPGDLSQGADAGLSEGGEMSFDILVTGGVLPDGIRADIAIQGDRIVEVAPSIEADAGRRIDATGCLVSPP